MAFCNLDNLFLVLLDPLVLVSLDCLGLLPGPDIGVDLQLLKDNEPHRVDSLACIHHLEIFEQVLNGPPAVPEVDQIAV